MGAPSSAMPRRLRLLVRGLVQGVGFRPYVFRLASDLSLSGSVANTPDGVVIEVEGRGSAVRAFADRLSLDPPPLARIDRVDADAVPPTGETGFRIAESAAAGSATTATPPDVATCDACLAEMSNPRDRRYAYPFINCTDCGPRFTIIEGVPYDRARTTMRDFHMCPECAAEYANPATRRFHAEPDACPVCGPRVSLLDAAGVTVSTEDAIPDAAARLLGGGILAVKGLGGFHLAADARNTAAVTRLRRLKQRDRKPFAVMASDAAGIASFAEPSEGESDLLRTPARPIVTVRKRRPFPLADDVAPGNPTIGVMLPYTPLHHLLLREFAVARPSVPPVLVMTSANPGDEPICRANDEAVERLAGIADAFLVHDRDVLARTDDSVFAHFAGAPRPIRRSRGCVPLPVTLPVSGPPVIAVGGDLKCAFCVTRGDEAFPGPHVGDLANAATSEYFFEAVDHLCALLEVKPAQIAHDMHPDYVSTRLAEALSARFGGAPRVVVQHHHAHVMSCLAEHSTTGPAIGLAMDGTGFGLDGTSWGGEVVLVHGRRWRRLARLDTLPLPGGDAAAREPWRIALAALHEAGLASKATRLAVSWPNARPDVLRAVLRLSAKGGLPRSSSLGRLFDAASAILAVRDVATFEGEAAIALEHAAWEAPVGGDVGGGADGGTGPYACGLDTSAAPAGPAVIRTAPLLAALADDAAAGVPASVASARFHASIVEALATAAEWAAGLTGVRVVALSGGSFQNRLLTEGLLRRLSASGLRVLTHSAVPANDGGLALGQALVALLS
ncbi:MAG: carbamoyltransferase HypF [Deltaproteobacteria bacterium]|nr:carbamoyltransferase HypF [Deltaproteobacteria bacterium]